MKYIITEEQYDIVIGGDSLAWVKRRYNLVKEELKDTFKLMEFDICRIDDYEKFEKKFFTVLMDGLHPYYAGDEVFDYDGVFDSLMYLFYV
jgi:hypothetical protein